MKRMLVAVDGSEHSLRAVRLAASLCKQSESSLFLVTVVAPSYGHVMLAGTYGVPVDPETIASLERAEEAWAQRVLAAAKQAAGELGATAQAEIAHGAPAERLLELARSPDVWMVVTGSRGHGKVASLLLGSVADKVVHQSSKPVLVVP